MRSEFIEAIGRNQTEFALSLTAAQTERLADYYDLVQEHNPLLHLVGPSSEEEFAIRHILESLTLLEDLPQNARFADVGAGAGLPSIPCLIVRADLKATIIESKEKKATFLDQTLAVLGLSGPAKVVNRQYAEVAPGAAQFVTCRALDKFTDKLPHLVRWARPRKMLLFGGQGLGDKLQELKVEFVPKLMPMSERRFLFVIGK